MVMYGDGCGWIEEENRGRNLTRGHLWVCRRLFGRSDKARLIAVAAYGKSRVEKDQKRRHGSRGPPRKGEFSSSFQRAARLCIQTRKRRRKQGRWMASIPLQRTLVD